MTTRTLTLNADYYLTVDRYADDSLQVTVIGPDPATRGLIMGAIQASASIMSGTLRLGQRDSTPAVENHVAPLLGGKPPQFPAPLASLPPRELPDPEYNEKETP